MGYRWKEGEELAAWKARQRHETVVLIAAGVVRPRPQACEQCGEVPRSRMIHMHHPDYEWPELVQWLCASCHSRASHRFPDIATWADYDHWYRQQDARRRQRQARTACP